MKKILSNIFPYILLLLLIVMWGSSFAALKVSLETIPPLWVMSLRLVIGCLTITTFFLILRKNLPLTLDFWKWSLIIGFLGFSVPFSIISWGTQFIPSSLVAILMGANPIITLILAYFFLADNTLTIRMVIGVFLGLLGIILLIGFGNINADLYKAEFIYGQLAVLTGTFSFALASILLKNLPQEHSFERTLGSLICGSIIGLFLAYFFSNSSLEIHEISIKSAVSLTLLGIFSTGIASVIWFKVIALKGPVFLALVNYLIPVWALILGIFLLNERINFIVGFGLIFITIGIWLIEKRTK
ncbi:DMT family transporter [Hyphomicrobiales bacterium]|nr:DMT family transporter [Hyphomicrobiales bacterium]MDG1523740.1 DMT family transporter [Hyphomicrobiales bacterium]MDG1665272.1 DMT family transporter [Hyphomicrobiales bacterium]|tara:strand:+ start:2761 stop:3660 length:900 start_codon:yes stop_codon:yes gene_type:complete